MSVQWSWLVSAEFISASETSRADRAILEAMERKLGEWSGAGGDAGRPVCSRSLLQKLVEDGKVRGGGKALKSNSTLQAGMRVDVEFPAPKAIGLVAEDRPIDVLFEDEHILVLNKPPGLTVHPSPTQTEGTLVHALLHHVKDLSGIGGELRPGIVHRIDKDTSGALVITKTDLAHQKLAEVFAKHEIERKYWALCYGDLEVPKGTAGELRIESLLARNPNDRKRMSMDVKEGRRAVTFVKRLEAYGMPESKPFATWVEVRLETGRTHQVRVHLTGKGHSILGDPVYGTPSSRHTKWMAMPTDVQTAVEALPGQALHARVLGFTHPVTGKALRFEAEPPPQFKALQEVLARYR